MNHFFPPKIFAFKCILIAFAFLSFTAQAQNGAIKGQISTSDGKPAAYVNVVLKELNRGTTSTEEGLFLIKNIKEGKYTLVTSFVGLQTQERIVNVLAGQTITIDFTLSENAQQLSEVVVSDTKSLNEKVAAIGKSSIKPLDLPQSITIIGRDVLEQQQVLRLSDVLRNTNGVYVMGTTGGTQEELAARGFAFGSSNTFKNGVRFNNGVMPETSSLEKVEILKGSSAILFGNVAAGGVLNLVTKKPKFENGGEVSMRIGSYNFYKPALDIYGAINNSEKFAYRLNTSYENAKSFRNEVQSERFYINPSLLVKLSKKTDILVEGDFLKDNRTPDYGIGAINYTIADVPRNRFLGASWSNYQVEQKSVTATATHQLKSNWQIRAVGGYQSYQNNLYGTARPTSIRPDGTWTRSLQRSGNKEDYYLAQADINGEFNTGSIKHGFMFGADADQYQTASTSYRIYALREYPDSVNATYDKINVFNLGEYQQRTDIPATIANAATEVKTGRVGIYAQDLVHLTEKIKVLAGLRYSYMESSSGSKDDAFTPRLGLVFQPVKTTSLFASYANSFNLNTGQDINGKALTPSFLNQYEVGIKNDLFKGLLSINLTAYNIINSDFAQAVLEINGQPNTNNNIKELAGEVSSKGIELDVMTKSIQGFSFIGGYSYNQTKYTKSNIYEIGSRLRYNPGHTANASIYYTFSENLLPGFNVGITGMYVGDMVAGRSTRLTIPNDVYRLIPLPNFFQFDLSAGYTIHKLSLRVRVTNVLNELGYYAHDDNSINPVAPRQFATTVSYKF